MLYHLQGVCPRTDVDMSRFGLCIQLFPAWRDAVAKSQLTQKRVNKAIQNLGRFWLDGCGYGQMFDPDKEPAEEWEEKHLGKTPKLGPRAHKLYGPESIQVQWGEWGPEHISVPGNACGLDLGTGCTAPRGGRSLLPHNIDTSNQVILLLAVFTELADHMIASID